MGVGAEFRDMLGITLVDALRLVKINCLAQVLVTKMFLKVAPEGRKGIIHVSSIASSFPFFSKGNELYCASKKFNQRYGTNLWHKTKKTGSLDSLVLKPGFVKTQLVGNREIDFITCSPFDCAGSALSLLGRRKESFGHFKHVLKGLALDGVLWSTPAQFVRKFLKPRSKNKQEKEKKVVDNEDAGNGSTGDGGGKKLKVE